MQQAITDALLNDRRLGVKYRRKGERELRGYVLSPLGLIQRGPVSYLLACIGEHEQPLHLRSASLAARDDSRRSGAASQGLRAWRTYLTETGALHFGAGRKIRLEAVFDAPAADHLHETPLSHDQTIDDLGEGRVRVRASVLDTPQLRWWLSAWVTASRSCDRVPCGRKWPKLRARPPRSTRSRVPCAAHHRASTAQFR